MKTTQVLFEMPVSIELRKSSNGTLDRYVKGYASTNSVDQDGEIVIQNGLDYKPLKKSGFINWDHQYREIAGARVPTIIGYPTNVEIRDNGLWVEGKLLKSEGVHSEELRLADYAWELGTMLAKSGGGRSLSYSVEGVILERHGNKIRKSVAHHIALTYKPVNTNCTVEMFAKSLCCGKCNPKSPLYIHGYKCKSQSDKTDLSKALSTDTAQPMMLENLDKQMTSVLYGDQDCGCYDKKSGKFKNGLHGAVAHLQECRGMDKGKSIAILRNMLQSAKTTPNIYAIVCTAGIAPP